VINALAPIMQFFAIFAPFKMTAPIPIKELSSIVQPCLLNIVIGFYRITCIKLVSKEINQEMDQCE